MIALALAWARAHWKPLGAAAALVASFGAGWFAHRPAQPTVVEKVDTQATTIASSSSSTTDAKGPTKTTVDETEYFDPWDGTTPKTVTVEPACPKQQLVAVPMPGPVRVVRHTVIEQGPEVVRTEAVAHSQEEVQQHVSLTVSPPPAGPQWAVGVGADDVLGNRKLRLELGRRLFGDVWLRVGATPARGMASATVGLEVRW